jgi:hypothetical protein
MTSHTHSLSAGTARWRGAAHADVAGRRGAGEEVRVRVRVVDLCAVFALVCV